MILISDSAAAAPRIQAAVEVAYPTPESSIASDLHRCDSVNSLGSMIGSPGAFSYSTSCASSEVDGTEYKYKVGYNIISPYIHSCVSLGVLGLWFRV